MTSNKTRFKAISPKTTLVVSALLLAVAGTGCSTDSTNAGSNRDDAATETTTSRMGQGLDAGTNRDVKAVGPMAQNSLQSAQETSTGSNSDLALTGDVTQDTSAVQEGPLNTSPSDVNGLPPAGEARDTTSGTTSGAIVTEETVEKKKSKKKMKKAHPAPAQPATEQAPMEAPAN